MPRGCLTPKLTVGHLFPKVLEYHGEEESSVALDLRLLHQISLAVYLFRDVHFNDQLKTAILMSTIVYVNSV